VFFRASTVAGSYCTYYRLDVSIAGFVCSGEATASSAILKGSGNSLPRFSARRRIPRQAFALKKYRCGTSPVSKTSDNEHTPAPLGNSEELSVQHSVGEPIPELPQRPKEGTKIPSLSA
jgi:hypothetical protein